MGKNLESPGGMTSPVPPGLDLPLSAPGHVGDQCGGAWDAGGPGTGTLIWPFQLEAQVSGKCVGRTLKVWGGCYRGPQATLVCTHTT